MPRLTETQYVCDFCKEPFEPAPGGPEVVLGRLVVWRPADDPREAVSAPFQGV